MSNTTTPQNNYFVLFTRYIKSNYKIIVGALIVIFILFISYQFYSYITIKNIHKNSITYFDAKDIELDHDFYKLMEKLYLNEDFYSVLSTLENIKINMQVRIRINLLLIIFFILIILKSKSFIVVLINPSHYMIYF